MATEKMTLQEKLATASDKKQEEQKKPEVLAYQVGRLRSFSRANGSIARPDADGIYRPTTEEDIKTLAYYDAQRLNYVHKL